MSASQKHHLNGGGGILKGDAFARNAPLSRLLSSLSCRDKKGSPPGGMLQLQVSKIYTFPTLIISMPVFAALIIFQGPGIIAWGEIMTNSLWKETASMPTFPTQQGSARTDVLIIGGGIAGILCAYMLAQAGMEYILVEEQEICSGITENTTAKVTAQHGMVFDQLLRRFGPERTACYLRTNLDAVEQYRKLCQDMDCGFQDQDSFVYSSDEKELHREMDALQKLTFSAQLVREIPIPVDHTGAVGFAGQAQFHPLRFLGHIAKELNIREHTVVRELKDSTAVTNGGRIRADRIIVATHFPFLNKHGSYYLKLYQQRSYVLALEQAQRLDGMYIGSQKNSLSFRGCGDLLLLGGGGHRTGKTGGNWAELKNFAQLHYPGASARYLWATQDCMTLDGLPYIGRYSMGTKGLYVATGFNKWGMTNAMAGAMLLRDMLQGKENPYADVVSPSRSILRPQLLVNAAEATGNLLRFSEKRCPHLGCALKWNPQERSWDCPCHGSRFDRDGHRLNNPATGDLKE